MTRSQMSDNLRYAIVETELGNVLVAASEKGVRFVAIGQNRDQLMSDLTSFADQPIDLDNSLEELAVQIVLNVKLGVSTDVPVDPVGTVFQQKVWDELRKIPAGETITYLQLARRVGNVKAVRAVAAACGANNLGILIPCHRVIGSNGKLTGFRWGIEVKQQLLAWEGAVTGMEMLLTR